MQHNLAHLQQVRFQRAQVALLEQTFPVREIKPGTPVDEIMYSAGVQFVLRFIKQREIDLYEDR